MRWFERNATWLKWSFVKLVFIISALISCSAEREGTYKIQKPVEVVLDPCGVPHIRAQSDKDAFFILGFLQAHFRLFQMDVERRRATGRLAQIWPPALTQDITIRSLGIPHSARTMLKALETIGFLDKVKAFVDGINTYIRFAKEGREFGGIRPKIPEHYRILQVEPEEWKVEDVIAIGKLRAFELSAGTVLKVLLKVFRDILGPYSYFLTTKSVAEVSIVDGVPSRRIWALSVDSSGKMSVDFPSILFERGSNNFVVSGKWTRVGYPILENDPHLSTSTPPVWIPVSIISPEYSARGMSFPGTPIVIVGAGQNVCWGLTVTLFDVGDVFFVPLRKRGDKYQVFWNGKWRDLSVVREVVRAKDGRSVELEFLWLDDVGPLLDAGPFSDEFPPSIAQALGISGIPNEFLQRIVLFLKKALAKGVLDDLEKVQDFGVLFAWTGFKPTSEISAFYYVANAKDIFNAMAYWRFFKVGSQNFIVADTLGNIGYFPFADYPVRNFNPLEPGFPPAGWEGYIPEDFIPRAVNPDWIVTANNDIIGTTFDDDPTNERIYVGPIYDIGFRAERIADLVKRAGGFFDRVTAGLIVNDINSYFARWFFRKMSYYIKDIPPHWFDDDTRKLFDMFMSWNFDSSANSPQALAFHIFERYFVNLTVWRNLATKIFSQRFSEWARELDPELFELARVIPVDRWKSAVDFIVSQFATLFVDYQVWPRIVDKVLQEECDIDGNCTPPPCGDERLKPIFGDDGCPRDEFVLALTQTVNYLKSVTRVCEGDECVQVCENWWSCKLGDFSGRRFRYITASEKLEKFEPRQPDGKRWFRKSGGALLVYAAGIDFDELSFPKETGNSITEVSIDIKKPRIVDGEVIAFDMSSGQSVKFICEAKPEGVQTWYSLPGGVDDNPDSPYFSNLLTAWACGWEWMNGITQGHCAVPSEWYEKVRQRLEKMPFSWSEKDVKFFSVFSEISLDFERALAGETYTLPSCTEKTRYFIFRPSEL